MGMWFGVYFVYIDSYLEMGSVFAKISSLSLLGGLLSIPLWHYLSVHFGKKVGLMVAMIAMLLCFLAVGQLESGQVSFERLFSLIFILMFFSASLQVIVPMLLSDIIDYGRLRDNAEVSAMYFSTYTLMMKMQFAIGGALGLAVVGLFGFDLTLEKQAEIAVIGLHLSVSWLPAIFLALAAIFVYVIPLNERRMKIVRRRLSAY